MVRHIGFWKQYHEQLVVRGEYYINPAFLEKWEEELALLNRDKVGQPYKYPTSMFEFSAVFHARGFDYRTCEGILRKLSDLRGQFNVPVWSQIRRRILQLSLEFSQSDHRQAMAIDGSGMKPSTRGDWLREKWKVKRGWIKVVLLGNTKGDIIDIVVGTETLSEPETARQLTMKHHDKISTLLLDGLHDINTTFDLCKKHNINPVIKIRSNANPSGLTARARAVRIYQSTDHKTWVHNTGYGNRWPASEGIFSAVKRIFGETVLAKKVENQFFDVRLKFWAHQRVRQLCPQA